MPRAIGISRATGIYPDHGATRSARDRIVTVVERLVDPGCPPPATVAVTAALDSADAPTFTVTVIPLDVPLGAIAVVLTHRNGLVMQFQPSPAADTTVNAAGSATSTVAPRARRGALILHRNHNPIALVALREHRLRRHTRHQIRTPASRNRECRRRPPRHHPESRNRRRSLIGQRRQPPLHVHRPPRWANHHPPYKRAPPGH